MDSITSAAIRYGSLRTRKLLFEPFDWRFFLRSSLPIGSNDPRSLELRRLRPYYKGTRALAILAALMFIPPFILPFTVPFIGFSGVLSLLFIYIILFFAVNVAGLFVEVCLDPILAIKYEKNCSFLKATKLFFRYSMNNPGQAIKLMGAKLIVDSLLMTVVMLFYMPALFALVWLLSAIVRGLTAGDPNIAVIAVLGFFAVFVLTLAAGLASIFITVPASAFYGYYTEEAVRHMAEA